MTISRAALVIPSVEAPYDYHWHAGPEALTVKTTVPTPCTPPFPKNQQAKRPLRDAWFGGCQPTKIACDVPRGKMVNATSNFQAAAEQARKNYRDSTAQLGLNTSIPESVRATAEKIVDKSREAYDRSKEALDASVTTLERTFDAAGQGAVAFNRKLIDIAQRNVNSGFDLAKSLARTKNLSEVVELQTAYWQKLLSTLTSQAEEVRALATKLAAAAGEPLKEQLNRVAELRKAN
jgi:phasin